MARYVVHKKGFFYTDDAYEAVEEAKGSLVGIYHNLEEAQQAKLDADISSLKNADYLRVTDFILYHDQFTTLYEKLKVYFKTEFGIEEPTQVPDGLTRQQAITLMEMMNVSFHNIVEYADEEVFDPADFGLKEEDELGEF